MVYRRQHLFQTISLLATVLLTIGCAVGPNYKRPRVDVPGMYRGSAPEESAGQARPQAGNQSTQPSSASLGDEKWWEVFQD